MKKINNEMTDKEIEFMKYFEKEIYPNRNNVTTDMVRYAGGLMNYPVNLICRSCLHNSAIDLLNLFNRMKPAWEVYKASLNEVYTKYQEEVESEPEITPENVETFIEAKIETPKKKNTK